jgi:aromatic-L-amino-acid decarboxylase
VDRCCDHAARFAARLRALPGFEILNDPVELNQVLVRIDGDDATTQATTAECSPTAPPT